jgi:alanine dehydrogenase
MGVARTSTYALNNVTLPHALRIAELGWKEALRRDPHLLAGLNIWDGKVTYEAVAADLDLPYTPAADALL